MLLSGQNRARQGLADLAAFSLPLRGLCVRSATQLITSRSVHFEAPERVLLDETKPTIVLFGWLGARTRYFQKHGLAPVLARP